MLEIIGAIVIIALGCVGHFIFEWSGHKKCAGIFFAVNESTWEHIKLSIYPAILWLVVEICVRGCGAEILVAQTASMLTMILLIPALFYGYTAIVGKNFLITDILCFIVSVCVGMWVFNIIAECGANMSTGLGICSIAIIAAILFCYFTFSYNPPRCFLFKDPITGGYGPTGHDCDGDFHHTGHTHHHHE